MRWVIVLLVVGCGRTEKAAETCLEACANASALAVADFEAGVAPRRDADEVRALAAPLAARDRWWCARECVQRRLDRGCVIKATSIDQAQACGAYPNDGPVRFEQLEPGAAEHWPAVLTRKDHVLIDNMLYAIEVPLRLPRVDLAFVSSTWERTGEAAPQPRFVVALGPAFPSGAVSYVESVDDQKVLFKEVEGDRLTFVYQTGSSVLARVVHRAYDRSLICNGTYPSAEVPDPTAMGMWLAQVCWSIRIQ